MLFVEILLNIRHWPCPERMLKAVCMQWRLSRLVRSYRETITSAKRLKSWSTLINIVGNAVLGYTHPWSDEVLQNVQQVVKKLQIDQMSESKEKCSLIKWTYPTFSLKEVSYLCVLVVCACGCAWDVKLCAPVCVCLTWPVPPEQRAAVQTSGPSWGSWSRWGKQCRESLCAVGERREMVIYIIYMGIKGFGGKGNRPTG